MYPTVTTTYTLHAIGAGGNTTATVTVAVTDAEETESDDRVRPKVETLTVNGESIGGFTEVLTIDDSTRLAVHGLTVDEYMTYIRETLMREPTDGDLQISYRR